MSGMLKKAFQAVVTEAGRCIAEYKAHHVSARDVLTMTPSGGGHPVLLLPAFGTDNWHMSPLKRRIEDKGYKVYLLDCGINLGLTPDTSRHLKWRLESIYKENGKQKVSLIGSSLGGLYAREMAREFPHMVRDVHTLGSPFANMDSPDHIAKFVRSLYLLLNPQNTHHLEDEEMIRRFTTPPPVPTTSTLSKSDIVVHWRCSLNPHAPFAENVEIDSSHVGMPWNPAAQVVVLDRLAQNPETWKPFNPEKYGAAFPSAVIKSDLPPNPKWEQGALYRNAFFKSR